MKRLILAGALLALGAAGLLAQPTTAPPAPAQKGAAPAAKGPTVKSQAEMTALQGLQTAARGGDPDALITAADDLLTKFPDTDFKDMVLNAEADAYNRKKDWIKAQIFAEKALEANPKSYQADLLMADILSQHTGEHDLDREEKLTKAEKYAHQAIDLIAATPKPRADITDADWEAYTKPATGQAYHDIALSEFTRKNWDAAITSFKAAIAADPQPAYQVQMASALQQSGKNDEAIALCDQVLAQANLHPAIKSAATNIKDVATKAKAK